jgi:hypothetical protein
MIGRQESILFLAKCQAVILQGSQSSNIASGSNATEFGLQSFLEKDDSIGVGSFPVIVNSPDVGGLCKRLPIDHDADAVEARGQSARNDILLQPDLSSSNLTNFERNEPARPRDSIEFVEYFSHHGTPVFETPAHGQGPADFRCIQMVEPTSKPVVVRVLNNVEERR